MIIDTDDESVQEYLREREEYERRQIQEVWPVSTAEVVVNSLPQWERSETLVGEDLPKVLLDEETEYTITRGVIDVVIKRNTATEQKLTILERDAVSYYSEGRHVRRGMAMPVLLPPSRRDAAVSGQMKLAIDVALALPHMRKSDHVVVIGSTGTHGIVGASYYLMAGRVSRVDLWDPRGPDKEETIEGTLFIHHKAGWPEGKEVEADVVFNDAYLVAEEKAMVLPVRARVYSVKDIGPGVEYEIKRHLPHAWRYGQLSDTPEARWVSPPRIAGRYVRKLGDCAACRELDYKNTNYDFSDYQMSVWRDQHAYKQTGCILSQNDRPPSQAFASTLTWRTHAAPVTARRADPRDDLHMVSLDEAMPRVNLLGYGFYCHRGFAWKFLEEEEREGDDEWRVEKIPLNVKLPNKAIALLEIPLVKMPGAPRSKTLVVRSSAMVDGQFVPGENKALQIWSAILVIDTFAYLLVMRESSSDAATRGQYCYGPLVAPRPIGSWVAYRYGVEVAKGRTGDLLSVRCVTARRTQRYECLGAFSHLD